MSEIRGIVATDLVVRAALLAGIADIRANPDLIDSAFASLTLDSLTKDQYGAKDIESAKKWFLSNDIKVLMDYRLPVNDPHFLSISLVDSTEVENTLGDINAFAYEDYVDEWRPLVRAFTPVTYSPSTGIFELPEDVGDDLIDNSTQMQIRTKRGHIYPVLESLDIYQIRLDEDINDDFCDCTIEAIYSKRIVPLESAGFRETVRIGVHAHGDPTFLTWGHALAVFILLRDREDFLEARGFERTKISSAPFSKNEAMGAENMWSRFITVSGFVRQNWPKAPEQRNLVNSIRYIDGFPVDSDEEDVYIDDGFTEDNTPWRAGK